MPKGIRLGDWARGERSGGEYREWVRSRVMTGDGGPMFEWGVAAFTVSGRPLVSGMVFEVACPSGEVEKMKMALDIRWLVCCVAALVG